MIGCCKPCLVNTMHVNLCITCPMMTVALWLWPRDSGQTDLHKLKVTHAKIMELSMLNQDTPLPNSSIQALRNLSPARSLAFQDPLSSFGKATQIINQGIVGCTPTHVPLWEILISPIISLYSGCLWVIIPKNPYKSPINNSMGTQLGVHPIVPWINHCQCWYYQSSTACPLITT